MSLIKWFNKPKWQNPNEQVRITAIQNSDDQELIHALPDIVASDNSVKVQKAALSRLESPTALLNILKTHPNKTIRQSASKKLILWFSQETDDQQMTLFNQIEDAETIKALAEKAALTTVREAAIEQISQQGLLGDLLFSETEESLQKSILEKINQPSTLTRLMKKAGKKHPALKAQIKAKLATKQSQNSDEIAKALCEQLESVVHGKNDGLNLAQVKSQWNQLGDDVNPALNTRFNGAFEAAKMIIDPEHRTQFLNKQKQLRMVNALNELETTVSNKQTLSLSQTQSAIQKFQDIDTELLNDEEKQRYSTAFDLLLAVRDQLHKDQQIPAAATQTLDQLTKQLGNKIVQPDQLNRFKKQWHQAIKSVKPSPALTAMKEQFDQAIIKLAEKIESSAELRKQAAESAVALIEPATKEIKEGHLSKAKEITNQLAEFKKTAGFNHPIIKRHKHAMDQVWNQLKELRNWQKWSNDKVRQNIIDDLAASVGKGLHPDAVLKKLKDANEQWYALEDMEKLAGDKYSSRNPKMWQSFRTVSKHLFEPTQPFFEKRSEQQDDRLNTINQTIEHMLDIDLAEAEERTLSELSTQAIKHLRALDQLPPKQRGKTAKKLRQGINRIEARLDEFYAAAAERKNKLIEQARALADVEDLNEAILAAKNLQTDWKKAGFVKHNQERKLWKKFRQANDAVFNRRDQEKQQQNEQHKAQLNAARTLLKQYQTQLGKAKQEADVHALKQAFISAWQQADQPSGMLASEYQQLLQKITDKANQFAQKKQLKTIKDKQELDALCAQFEQQEMKLEELIKTAESINADLWEDTFKARVESPESDHSLADMLIQAEFLSGLETPKAYMEERMAHQVKVLAERMSGERELNNQQQAKQWLGEWFSTPKVDQKFWQSEQGRIEKVIKAMVQQTQE